MRKASAFLLSCLAVVASAPHATAATPMISAPSGSRPVAVDPTITKIDLTQDLSAASAKGNLLTVKQQTSAFQTVGVTWKGRDVTPDLQISVRTRQDASWTGWQDLDSDAGDDDVAQSGVRGGTDPLYVGPSTGVQAKIVVKSGKLPAEMKLELVDPGRSDYDSIAAAVRPGAYGAATAARPTIMTRAQWGADESKVKCSPEFTSTIKAVVLHHTAGKNGYTAAQVPSIIRGDYAYHLSRGWCDIGYNALVDRFGRIWEGRAGGLDKAVIGAHAGGFNIDTFGVSMIGNYDVTRPSSAAVNAVAKVFAWKLAQFHRDPKGTTQLTSAGGGTARYPAGKTMSFPVIMGHRNTGFTACPGKYLYPYLPQIRTKATQLMQAALINPTLPKTTAPLGSALTITARALRKQSWRLDVTAPCNGGRVARLTGNAAAGTEITATWNGRLANGTTARPGNYALSLTSSSSTGSAIPVARTVLVTPPLPRVSAAMTPSSGEGGYVPVTPSRIYDTRSGTNVGVGPGGSARIPVLGVAGVPTEGITSVVLNLTASCATAETALTVYPTGRLSVRPVSAVPAGVTRSVLVTTRIGADGSITVGNARSVTELTADVLGYYTASGAPVQPIDGTRIYDSRAAGGPLTDGQVRTVTLPTTLGGISSALISGVIADVSAVRPAGAGTLVVGSGDLPTLTYRKGETIDNLTVVPVSGGLITLRNTGSPADALLDVRGVITPQATGAVTAVKPVLLTTATLKEATPKKVTVTGSATAVPSDATGVLIMLTATEPTASTALNAYPYGGTPTNTAVLRVVKGATRSNQVLVPIGTAGAISLLNGTGDTGVRVDVVGYVR
jgi:hypothetical protein